jgi:hypothetical protein
MIDTTRVICADCGTAVTDWGLHIQTCPHRRAEHEHVWTIGRVETEADWGNPMYHRVVYLLCQCGATKRTVPE